jgi:RNA polymerase sigma-70 factor (ECF subfamily)
MTVEKSTDRRTVNASADEATLTSLYEQFKRPIHSYTYRLLGNLEDADDVTQEVFVRACTSWNGLYERENLSAWLYRIATNLCVDALRRRKRISWWPLSPRNRDEDFTDDMPPDSLAYFLSDTGGIPEIAERDLIRLTLANMSEEYAIVLVLNAAQGVSYQEIAEIVGITPNAAATRISRAKKMFAERYQRLSKDGVGKQEKPR